MSRERAGRKAGVMIVIGSATVLAAGLTGSDAGLAESSESSGPQEQIVTVTEGTNAAAAAAPDGSVIMELQGLLFRVPAGGGDAEALTDPELQPSRPDVGDDGRIAFQSYADGRFHVSTMAADGSDVEQVTDGEFDDREPRWSPDGTRIAFSSDRGGSYDIWTVDVTSGELQQWTNAPGAEVEPSWHPDGTRIAYSTAGATDASTGTIESTTADGQVTTLVPEADGEATFHAPSWAPDGDEIAYIRVSGTQADLMVGDEAVTSGQDVFVFTPVWTAERELMYTADGAIRVLDVDSAETHDVPFSADISLPDIDYDHKDHDFDSRAREQVTGVLTPALSPDATQVAFVALNDLWIMPVDGEPERITDDEFHVVDPVWSRDGKQLAYSSDRAGTEDIYIRDMSTGDEQRVTAMDGAEVSASFSPDGTELAFQDQDGATYVLTLDTGDVRELVPALFGPGRPSWSPDGSTIAFAAVKRYSERFREGTSQILTVDVDSGKQTFHAPGDEHDSISTRGDDGPVWSPDGTTMAFVVNSTLQVMPVDESGAPTGPARQINDDVADAPTWSGDSSQLLYMSNGELRLADASTGEAETVDVDLTYRPDRPTGSTTIHAGAFWDGTSRELQHDVDIVVEGNRIRSVSPHDDEHREGEVVDASDLTVMPGLWDSHVHQEYASRFFGDRQGRLSLSYGITSTVSVGDQVYRAMEDREALEAGERVGPNFYATGEPIDGSRVYYNFMRPTTSDEQVDRELSRARALDYDFLKTYVRLPADRMRTVIDAAHDMGVPSGSHYLSPGAHLGQDGTTHLAATQRLGFARTSTATGATYSDVPSLYGAGERSVTTTLFTEDFLYGEELEADPRTDLLPPWERDRLLEETADNVEPPADPDCETPGCQEVRTFAAIADHGGRVLTGTDSPIDNVALGVHANLRMLVEYGWSPYDALRTATINPARHMGVDGDVGTLEQGKVADLIMVDGDPLANIDDAMNVRMTMSGGRLHSTEDLTEPFAAGSQEPASERSGALPATEVTARVEPGSSRYWWHAPEVVAADNEHNCGVLGTHDHRQHQH